MKRAFDHRNTKGKNMMMQIIMSAGCATEAHYLECKAIWNYKGGKMPNPDWYGKKYAKTWSHILKKLRKGKIYLGARSSASGLGQMTLSNVRKFYPSGLDGIGDPYEEAAGMLLYIKSRYGSPVEAWAQYGGCSPDGKYSRKHIPAKKRGKPCNPPYDAEKKPGIAGLPRPNSPNKRGHDHEGY
jgi:hypothetical protein